MKWTWNVVQSWNKQNQKQSQVELHTNKHQRDGNRNKKIAK